MSPADAGKVIEASIHVIRDDIARAKTFLAEQNSVHTNSHASVIPQAKLGWRQ